MEHPMFVRAGWHTDVVLVTVEMLPVTPGALPTVLAALAAAGVVANGMRLTPADGDRRDLVLLLPESAVVDAVTAVQAVRCRVGFARVLTFASLAEVHLDGFGLLTGGGITARFLSSLASAGIAVRFVCSDHTRIAGIVTAAEARRAARVVSDEFCVDVMRAVVGTGVLAG